MRVGLLISLLAHLVVFFSLRSDRPQGSATVAAGPRAGDSNAAAGSGALQAISFAEVRSIEIPPPPAPLPSLDAPEVTIVETRPPSFATGQLERPGSMAGRQAGFSPGLPGGTGEGDGGSDAEGRYRNTVPEPRVIIPDWDPPNEVKGMRVRMRVLVDERGNAVDVELEPPTPNDRFNRKLIETAMAMEFKPALRNGRPVRDWAVITRIF
ncbi:MAG: energy transducer TonB [marine benthic group bacterium]|nr:energy transducer TonB [Gemmatimonadota bacterium]